MIGLGPIGAHGELKVTVPPEPPVPAFLIEAALLAPCDRCWPACSTLSGVSPAVRLRMKASLSWINVAASSCPVTGNSVPGMKTGASPTGDGTVTAIPVAVAAATIAIETTNALSPRRPRFPIFLSCWLVAGPAPTREQLETAQREPPSRRTSGLLRESINSRKGLKTKSSLPRRAARAHGQNLL